VLYVEELIGPTINTCRRPRSTRSAIMATRDSLRKTSGCPPRAGRAEKSASLDVTTAELVKDGVRQFADTADRR
jgi:transaldolase/glucose-6-phosphate isomerase